MAAAAGPFVLEVAGKARDGERLVIRGESFGEKSPAKPLVWADFRTGINPSGLGRVTRWNQIQNMEWSRACGDRPGPCAAGKAGAGAWTLRVDADSWTAPGQRFYVFKHERMNFSVTDPSQNWKSWRMWPKDQNYPNIYAAPSNGRVYVENVGPESGFWGSFSPPAERWHTQEIIGKASSARDAKDGHLRLCVNGTEKASGSIMTCSAKAPARMTKNYVVHGVAANRGRWRPEWRESNRLWVDDVYADTSWARVLIGDQPTHVGSRHWEIQIPQQWSNSEVIVQFNQGAFKDGQQVYLYVYNKDGVTNLRGHPIRIGSGDQSGAGRLSSGKRGS